MSDPSWDLVIVGSGAGGLAAAINAKLLGLRPLVLEKTSLIGGSSVMSGGVLWLPNNPLLKREGIADSRAASLRYMENFVGKDAAYSTPARRAAFVDNIEEFVTTMEAQGMKYRRCHGYSDYYDHLPGGVAASRSIEAELFNVNRLGEWKARLRAPSFPVPIRTSEAAALMRAGITLDGKMMAARVAGRFLWSKLTGQALYGAGGSLQGRMLEIALQLKCELWTEAGLVDLDIHNGRVEGVHVNQSGRPTTIRATRGVLIAAGGFARNSAMRQKYQRQPISDEWTWANPGDTGEAIEVMQRAGAAVAVMDEAWWNTTWFPAGGAARVIIPEMAKPHTLLVDHAGQRFVDEANSYMEVGSAMYRRHATTPAIPAWLVMDIRARKRYFFGFQPPGRIPRQWIERGWVKVDDTIAGLARKCGIDLAGLEATVARYNGMCESGVDADYGRGASAYNRYYADPTYKLNPCMGPISEPPFWAVPLHPGDVGTSGGAITNERAEVLRADGSVIDGLYAAGNCAASLCGPHYVGAGQSIGASSIFGYIAAKQAAR